MVKVIFMVPQTQLMSLLLHQEHQRVNKVQVKRSFTRLQADPFLAILCLSSQKQYVDNSAPGGTLSVRHTKRTTLFFVCLIPKSLHGSLTQIFFFVIYFLLRRARDFAVKKGLLVERERCFVVSINFPYLSLRFGSFHFVQGPFVIQWFRNKPTI